MNFGKCQNFQPCQIETLYTFSKRFLRRNRNLSPSQIFNLRQRKSFRSRLNDLSRSRSSNEVPTSRSSEKVQNKNDRQKSTKMKASYSDMLNDWNYTSDTKKRPNVVLMMSDDQVK